MKNLLRSYIAGVSLMFILLSISPVVTYAADTQQDFDRVKERVNQLQSTDPSLPGGVAEQKGRVGTILSEIFDGNGKIGNIFLKILGTRSDNQLMRWDATTGQLVGSSIIYDGTNVGIGTTSPGKILDVVANQNANSSISISNNSNTSNASAGFGITGEAGGFGYMNLFPSSSSLSGLEDRLVIRAGHGVANGIKFWAGNNSAADISFNTIGSDDTATKMIIKNNGNVGIGDITPSYKLDVNGDINFTGDLRQNGVIFDAGGGKFVDGTDTNDAVYIGGNVGIGTTNPDVALDVDNGIVRTGRYGAPGALILNRGGGTQSSPSAVLDNDFTGYIGFRGFNGTTERTMASIQSYADEDFTSSANGGYLTFFTTQIGAQNPNEKLRITSNGNVGIGTTSPATRLEVFEGTLRVSGASALGQDTARFVVDTGASTAHSPLEFRNDNGITFRVNGLGEGTFAGTVSAANPVAATDLTTKSYVDTALLGAGGGKFVDGSDSDDAVYITGNVGIGTTSPAQALTVVGQIQANRGSNQFALKDVDGDPLGSVDARPNGANAGDIRLTAANTGGTYTPRLAIKGDTGNVGIGTTSPSADLEVSGGSNNSVKFVGAGSTLRFVNFGDDNWIQSGIDSTAGSAADLRFSTMNGVQTHAVIKANGNVGIGVSDPTDAKLEVAGNIIAIDPTENNHVATKVYVDNAITVASNNDINALSDAKTSATNLFLGTGVGDAVTTADNNTAVGQYALQQNVLGTSNTAIGRSALQNTTGAGNTAVGNRVLENNTTGNNNTAMGQVALLNNTTGSSNVGIGQFALEDNTTGNYNIGIGPYALSNATTRGEQVAVGYLALQFNTTGYSNVALGTRTLQDNTTGANNTALGSYVLTNNTTGYGNIGAGQSSLQYNTTGYHNTAVGSLAIRYNTTGYGNSALGRGALANNTTGYYNNAFGRSALVLNTTGAANDAFGAFALDANTTGDSNNAFGYGALSENTTGILNSAFGRSSLDANTTGSYNSALGGYALSDNTTGAFNVALGAYSLFNNTTGNYNQALGYSALFYNTTGNSNVAIGHSALQDNTTGSNNTGIGYINLANNTTGNNNTSLGGYALSNNTTGANNVAIGYNNLAANTTGVFNTAVGFAALDANTTAANNVALGYYALSANTIGAQNTALGATALDSVTTGGYNTAVGYNALGGVTTGVNNTTIGSYAGDNITTGSSNIIIGANVDASSATGDNQLNIGNTIYGNLSNGRVGIGTSTPLTGLDVLHDTGITVRPNTGSGFPGNIRMVDALANVSSRDDMQFSTLGGFMFKMDDGNNGISGVQGFNVYDGADNSVFAIEESSGNVGIGTTSPGAGLDIATTHSTGRGLKITQDKASISNNTYTLEVDSSSHNTNVSAAGAMAVDVSSGRAFTINGFGRVGIGTSSPTQALDVDGNAAIRGGVAITRGTITPLDFQPSDDSSVNWRIGTTSVAYGGGHFDITDTTGGGSPSIRVEKGTRNVGIKVTDPTEALDVNGNGKFTGTVTGATPTAASHLTTKSYVDNLITQGVSWKAPVDTSAAATYGACDAAKEGWATYNKSDDIIYLCNASAWVNIGNSASVPYATTTTAGRVQLSGDIGGTWDNVQLTNDSVVSANIVNNTITETDISDSFVARNSNLLDGIDSTSFLRSNADDTFTGKLSVGTHNNRRAGIYGIYDSTKIGHIWSIGTAYQIPQDGANFGNLYGLAYKHTNNPTGGTMAGGHQVVFSNNGSPRAAMGGNSGLWTYNSVVFGQGATQRLYGDNNSAIYLDSNNSDISTLVFRDAEDDVYGRIQGGQGDYFGIVDGDSNWAIQHLKDTHTMFAINNVEKARITNDGLNLQGNDLDFVRGNTSQIRSVGRISFDWTGGTYDSSINHGIESKDENGAFADKIRINSYGDIINTIDANSNSTSRFVIQKESTGNGTDLFTINESGTTSILGTVSAATPTAAGHLTTKAYVDAAVGTAGDNLGNHTATQDITVLGYDIDMRIPNSTGGWARGLDYFSFDGATRLGGIGMLGTVTNPTTLYMGFGTGPWSSGNGLYVKPGGSVGVGVFNPSEKLDVAGNANISGTIYAGQSVYVQGASAEHWLGSHSDGRLFLGAGRDADNAKNNITLYNTGCTGGCNVPLINLYADTTNMFGDAVVTGAVTAADINTTRINLDYAASTPASGPSIRWSDGTQANTLGFYVNGGINYQGNSVNSDFKVRTPTTDGTLGTVVFQAEGDTGRVGIGTSTPGFPLHVDKTITNNTAGAYFDFSGSTGEGNGVVIRGGGANSGRYILKLNDNANNERFRVLANGNVGIGTTNPNAKLAIGGTRSQDLAIKLNGASAVGASSRAIIEYGVDSGQLNFTADQGQNTGTRGFNFVVGINNALTINTARNVGIGTTTPSARLEVDGTSKFNGNINLLGRGIISSSTDIGGGEGGVILQANTGNGVLIRGNGGGATSMIVKSSGRVGIGNTTPYTKLDVSGTIRGGSAGAAFGSTIIEGLYSQDDVLNTFGSLYSSAATALGYGVRPKVGATGYVSSADNAVFDRGALEMTNQLVFRNATSSSAANGTDVTMVERFRINSSGDGYFSGRVIAATPTANNHLTTKSYVDSAITAGNTDTQDLSISGNTLSLTNGGSVTLPASADTQDLSISGRTISLINGGSVTVPSSNTDTQNLSISGNTLSLTNGGSVTLPTFTNTDNQALTLNTTTDVVSLEDGGTIDLTYLRDNTDTQDLSISGNTLSLTDGGSVTLPGGSDDLGNHTATQDISIGSNNITGTTGSVVTAGSFIYASDKRLKTNFEPLKNTQSILGLGTYRYDWKDSGESDIGLIAQEVEEVFPEFIQINDQGYKGIDYVKMVVPLLEVTKKQQAEIDELKAIVKQLQNK